LKCTPSPLACDYQILGRAGSKYLLAAQQADMKTTAVYAQKPLLAVKDMEGLQTFTTNQPCWLLSIFAWLPPLAFIFQCRLSSPTVLYYYTAAFIKETPYSETMNINGPFTS
jgi:hypothetical protein